MSRTTSQLAGSGAGADEIQGNVASDAVDIGNPVKVGTKVNVTPPTFQDGDRADLQSDINGNAKTREQYATTGEDNVNGVNAVAIRPLATSTYSWSLFTNFGANATLNVKASTGNIKSVYCHNLNAAVRYLQLHNTATTPGGGAVPLLTFLVPATGVVVLDGQFFGENGFNFTTGIAFAFSTTEGTYTAGAAGDQFTQIMYK